jgi:hypothetical protein
MTQFPSGTSVVYAIFEYADMTGESIKVRVYDNYGSILLEEDREYTGSGTDAVETTTSEGYFPDGRYVTNFYQGEYLARTVIWEVGEPVAQPTPTPTTTASTASSVVDRVKDLAVPAAAVLLIVLVVWAIYRALATR